MAQSKHAMSLMSAIAHMRRENDTLRRNIETGSTRLQLSAEQSEALGLGQGFDVERIVDDMELELDIDEVEAELAKNDSSENDESGNSNSLTYSNTTGSMTSGLSGFGRG